MRGRWAQALAVAAIGGWVGACAAETDDEDTWRPEVFDTPTEAADADADAVEARTCASSDECNDGVACTVDTCGADRLCRNRTMDELCDPGQRCDPTTGCTAGSTDCSGHAECQDGLECNGSEQCLLGRCYPGDAMDCDDGNPCTEDLCPTDVDYCVHNPLDLEGCEVDGGEVVTPFDPAVHYNGFFALFPAQSSGCFAATYNINEVEIVSSGGTLVFRGAPCDLSQASVPATADFSVSCVQSGCGTYSLAGSFSDADHFTAHWTASFSGGCSMCPGQNADVWGTRR